MKQNIKAFLHQLSAKIMMSPVKKLWILQRVTAVLLVPVVIWLGSFFHYGLTASYSEFSEWLLEPLNLVCLFVFLGVVVVHSYLGLRVIVEDYLSEQKHQRIVMHVSFLGFCLLIAGVILTVIILFFRV